MGAVAELGLKGSGGGRDAAGRTENVGEADASRNSPADVMIDALAFLGRSRLFFPAITITSE